MKKFLTSLLCVMMVVCFMPAMAWADGDEAVKEASVTSGATTTEYETLEAAITAAEDGDTVTLLSDVTLEAQLNINSQIALIGNSHTVTAAAASSTTWPTDNNSKHLVNIGATATIQNVTFDSNNNAWGVQGYCSTNTKPTVTFEDVTMTNSKGTGLQANGANVIVRNVTVENSGWSQSFDVSDGNNVVRGATVTIGEGCNFNDPIKIFYDTNQTPATVTAADGTPLAKKTNPTGKAGLWTNTPAAMIGNTYYYDLSDAVDAAGNSETKVTLLKDIVEDVTIGTGKVIVLNLNGCKITNIMDHTIINKGTLTVEGAGTIDNVTHAKAALWNDVGATATLNGGEFTRSLENGINASNNGGNSYYAVLNHGTMEINDGVQVTQNGHYSSLLENGWQNGNQNTTKVASVLTINGGIFTGGLNTIKNDDYGEITINGGTFKNTTQASFLNWNVATVNGGNFDSEGNAILNGYLDDTMDKGMLTINGGTFNAKKATLEKMGGSTHIGEVVIEGGIFTSAEGVSTLVAKDKLGEGGSLTVKGGTFSSDVKEYMPLVNETVAPENRDYVKYIKGDSYIVVPKGGSAPSHSSGKNIWTWNNEQQAYVESYVYTPTTPTTQKPVIEPNADVTTSLSADGTTLTIKANDGYEITDVTVNGVSKGAVDKLTGLKTGDKVVIKTQKVEKPDDNAALIEAVKNTKLVARSAMSKAKGKKAVKVYWYAKDGSDLDFDGYEVYRSLKRYSGFGKTPFFKTTNEKYYNTAIKKGTKYYYKVRAYKVINGEKVYTDWSTKAWRTVK